LIVAGVDIGSLTGKVVLLKFNSAPEIVASSVVPSTISPQKTSKRAMDLVLKKSRLVRDDIEYIVGTGYGRIRIPFANKNFSEIACHGRGAHHFLPNVRTIVDIGGQDSKVIKIDGTGKLLDFAMNDKCAAGTGRFLEIMANALEMDIEELGPLSLKSKKPALITSQCSVFAESEVISLVAEGKNVIDIVAGIHQSIASRIISLINRVGLEQDLTMTGGVAKNIGVRKALEGKLGVEIKQLPVDPQLMGAMGAALIAMDELKKDKEKSKTRKLKEWNF